MKKQPSLVVTLHESNEIERFVAIVTLGLCAGIEKGVVSVSDAEVALFSPYSAEMVKRAGGSELAQDLILHGGELEATEMLPITIAEMLPNLVESACKVLAKLQPIDRLGKKWIDEI